MRNRKPIFFVALLTFLTSFLTLFFSNAFAAGGIGQIDNVSIAKINPCTPLSPPPPPLFSPPRDNGLYSELINGLEENQCVDVKILYRNTGTDSEVDGVEVKIFFPDTFENIEQVIHYPSLPFPPVASILDSSRWVWNPSEHTVTITAPGILRGGYADTIYVLGRIKNLLPEQTGALKEKIDAEVIIDSQTIPGRENGCIEDSPAPCPQNRLYFNRKPTIDTVTYTVKRDGNTIGQGNAATGPIDVIAGDNVEIIALASDPDRFRGHANYPFPVEFQPVSDPPVTPVFNCNYGSTSPSPQYTEVWNNEHIVGTWIWTSDASIPSPPPDSSCTIHWYAEERNGNSDFHDRVSEQFQVNINVSLAGYRNIKPTAIVTVKQNGVAIPVGDELEPGMPISVTGNDQDNYSRHNGLDPNDHIETWLWEDLGANLPGFTALPAGALTDPASEDFEFTGALSARYKVKLTVTDTGNPPDNDDSAERVIRMFSLPLAPKLNEPADMCVPPDYGDCFVKTAKNAYATKDQHEITVSGIVEPTVRLVKVFLESDTTAGTHVYETPAANGTFTIGGSVPFTFADGEHRFLIFAYKEDDEALRSRTGTRLVITMDPASPEYDLPVGIRFPAITGNGGNRMVYVPVGSIAGKLKSAGPGITTRVYANACTGSCSFTDAGALKSHVNTVSGPVSKSGDFSLRLRQQLAENVPYDIYILYEKNTGAQFGVEHLGPFTVQTDNSDHLYLPVTVTSHDPEPPKQCVACDLEVTTDVSIGSPRAAVSIGNVTMYYFDSDKLPPKIETTNLEQPLYFTTYPDTSNGKWELAGTGNGSEAKITWSVPDNIPDEEQRFYALGFQITYCALGDSPCDNVTNIIHQPDGSYYPYIIDNGEPTPPSIERINGEDIDPNEGAAAGTPIVFTDSAEPSPFFSGMYAEAIPGVPQRVGISIYNIDGTGNATGSAVAVKRDIPISETTRKWAWKYVFGSTVHPLEIGTTYCLKTYRVVSSMTPVEPAGCRYFRIDLNPEMEVPAFVGYYINPKIADGDSRLRLEVLLTDEYGNVIIDSGDDTAVTVNAPYLPDDDGQNIDTDQVTPLFDASAVETVNEDGSPLADFVPEGSGKNTRYIGYIESFAPTLDLSEESNGVANPGFGDSIRKALGYGLNINITDDTLPARTTASMDPENTEASQAEAYATSYPLVKLDSGDPSEEGFVFFNTYATATPPQVHFAPALTVDVAHLIKRNDELTADRKYVVDGIEKIQFVTGDEEYFRITMTNASTLVSVEPGHASDTLALKSIIEFANTNASFDNVQVIGWRIGESEFTYAATPESGTVEWHDMNDNISLEPGVSLEIDIVANPAFKMRVLSTAGSIVGQIFYAILRDNPLPDMLISIPLPTVALQILNPRGLIIDVPERDAESGNAASFTDLEKEIGKNVEKATRDPGQDSLLAPLQNIVGDEQHAIVARTAGGRMAFSTINTSGDENPLDPSQVPTYMNGSVYYFGNSNVIMEPAQAGDRYLELPSTPTTIVTRGNIVVKTNLVRATGASFGLIALPVKDEIIYPDPYSQTPRNEGQPGGNIFIAPSVTGVQSDIFAAGAILAFDPALSGYALALTSLSEALNGAEGALRLTSNRASDLINQLVLEGLIASGNTWNASINDDPFGEEYDSYNRDVDLAKARVFSTHLETPANDIDGDGVMEQTPNDYVTETEQIDAERSFLLTGIPPGEANPRQNPDYNLEKPPTGNYNSAVVVGRSETSTSPAPLFTAGTTLNIEERGR